MRHFDHFSLTLIILTILGAAPASAFDWPQFRGTNARGIAEQQRLPDSWDPLSGDNVLWRAGIDGLSHSSPIVWGGRVYLTTAVANDGTDVRFGTGDSDAVGSGSTEDLVAHDWQLIAFDLRSGDRLWDKTVHRGVPRVKRHVKASHASATPATDGERLVVLLGSEGLFCFDMDGELSWRTDVGVLDVGYWGERQYQWGPASSPVIGDGLVFVQNDRQEGSFLAAYDLTTGKERWRAERDEKPAWSSPALYRHAEGTSVITNGANFMRANDARTGAEIWRVSHEDLQVITPSPIVVGDRAIVTGGNPTGANAIFSLNAGGEIEDDGRVAWKVDRGSPYTPTPLAYDDILYVIVDNGILSAYDLATGERHYRTRVNVGSGFSASPVAVDGKIYLASEDGDVFIIRAGPEYECLEEIEMGEALMATPAVSDGVLLLRGRSTLFAIGAS